MSEEFKQRDLDNLADIIWWIKGYMAGVMNDDRSCPFAMDHVESLRKARLMLGEIIKPKEDK